MKNNRYKTGFKFVLGIAFGIVALVCLTARHTGINKGVDSDLEKTVNFTTNAKNPIRKEADDTTIEAGEHFVMREDKTSGRVPKSYEYIQDLMDYDPEDTIYYKDYYDDIIVGVEEHIDYSPHMEIREELEDYFTDDLNEFHRLDYMVSMFYDDRTIQTDEKELEQLFWDHGYILSFHNAEYQDYRLRFIEITEKDGLSLYPFRILMQTWDEDFIYLQDITSIVPRKIMDLMVVDDEGIWKMVVHSTGLSREMVVEEEISFWEFTGTYWILVPMEVNIDTSHAHFLGTTLYPDLDRDELYEAVFYRDGITYSPSQQSMNEYGDQWTFRLGIMEVTEENRRFRLIPIFRVEGRTVYLTDSYIQFAIQ